MNEDFKREVRNTAIRVNAYIRVFLRKHLRSRVSPSKYPKHFWLDHDISDLTVAVNTAGGNAEELIAIARREITSRIHRGD